MKAQKKKFLAVLQGEEIANRFDMASEVWIGTYKKGKGFVDERIMILPQASEENLCQLIITEGIHTMICGGIEQEYYDYLTWKKISIIDFVIGDLKEIKKRIIKGKLKPGDIVNKTV